MLSIRFGHPSHILCDVIRARDANCDLQSKHGFVSGLDRNSEFAIRVANRYETVVEVPLFSSQLDENV